MSRGRMLVWGCNCGSCSAFGAGSPRGRRDSNAGEVPLLPEARGAPKNTFSVEQGPGAGKRDPKEAAARGWAKLRDTVKSAKCEAQTVVSARTAS